MAVKEKNGSDTVLSDRVYNYILESIFTNKLKVGEKIPDSDIVKKLNISRTPVREAIRKLANEGIIIIYPKRYAEIYEFTKQDFYDIGITRISLGALAGQLAIQYGSNMDFYHLRELAEKCKQAEEEKDSYNKIKYDCDFHLTLAKIGRNKILYDIYKNLFLKIRLMQTQSYEDKVKFHDDWPEHKLIVEELLNRDKDKVIKAIVTHLATFYELDLNTFSTAVINLDF